MNTRTRPLGLRAFTLIELLVVITVIAILAGLVLGTAGYIQKKSARSRVEAEIASLSAALENYRAEHGAYPPNAASGVEGSRALYQALSDAGTDANPSDKIFFEPPLSMLGDADSKATAYFVDPFGSAYEYRSGVAATNNGEDFFDLWSVADANPVGDSNQWIKNW